MYSAYELTPPALTLILHCGQEMISKEGMVFSKVGLTSAPSCSSIDRWRSPTYFFPTAMTKESISGLRYGPTEGTLTTH